MSKCVTLTVARADLAIDTAWWGVPEDPFAVGQATVMSRFETGGFRYVPDGLVVLPDTAEALATNNLSFPARVGHYRRIGAEADLNLWVPRMQQPYPRFSREARLQLLAGQADSLLLTVTLAPDSAFCVATSFEQFRHGDPDQITAAERELQPLVSWQDRAGRVQHQRFSRAAWEKLMQPPGGGLLNRHRHLMHYVDYQ